MKFHLALPVSNIKATNEFYRLLFKSDATKIKEDYVKFELELLDLTISFVKTKEKHIDTDLHLGLQILTETELENYYQWLEQHQLISPQKTRETATCCYAKQDKFWAHDPDGYEWEFYYKINDSEQKSTTSQCCANA